MQYHLFTKIWVYIVFLFHPFKASFSLSKEKGFFSPLPPSAIDFSIKLLNFLITHECDLSLGSLLSSAIQYQAFVFSPFGGWQGGNGPRVGLPEWDLNTDYHSSLIARPKGRLARGSVSQILWYIYAPPQNRPRSGDTKQIIPLTGDAAAFGHAYVIPCMIVFSSPLQSNSIFSSLSLTIILGKTFLKWSIITLSRLSKLNQHLASYQFVINQVYQIRKNIWQDINYNFNESRK